MKLKPFVKTSKKGKVAAGSLTFSYKKPQTGYWKDVSGNSCSVGTNTDDNSKSFEYSITELRSNLGNETVACNLILRSVITGINFFYDENDGEFAMISDGGGDMYDGGNALNTNYTQLYDDIKEDNQNDTLNIPYTHTQATSNGDDYLYVTPPMDGDIADGTDYFGSGSQYFTNMYPGVFIMAASGLNDVTQFSICGNIGTDGNGVNFYYKQPTSYIGWTAYYKTNNDQSTYNDPSINHIILVKGSVTEVEQVGDTEGSYDDHALIGLTNENTDIIYALFSTLPSVPPVTKEQFRSVADMILSVAAGTDPCND